jgi:hypothetical protein
LNRNTTDDFYKISFGEYSKGGGGYEIKMELMLKMKTERRTEGHE